MDSITLTVNKQHYQIQVDPNMPLLWVLRDELGIHSPKYGCGQGLCGACTVLVNGVAMRSCITPVGIIHGAVTTVEGLGSQTVPSVVQQAWITHQVAQCGYCQPGQIITATALLTQKPNPTDTDIDAAMSGNLCRCGTYPRIKAAIKTAATQQASSHRADSPTNREER